MRPIRSLLLFLLVVFLGGALLAPWLCWLTQRVAHVSLAHCPFHDFINHLLLSLADSPFHRFVNRSLLGLALIGIWPLLRSLGAKSWREVGIINPAGEWKRLWTGMLLGFSSLACVAIMVLAAHARQLNIELTAGQLAGKVAGAVATAIIVAVVEELLFRGAIFGALRRIWDWRAALVMSSMIYAIVHFMQSADITGPVTWHSGLEVLPRMLRGFGNWEVVIPGFFNLTLAGILLGLAYQRTGNLYFSIGLHAGWIFWLKSYGLLTTPVTTANQWLWGTQKLIDGWLALLVLLLTWFVLTGLLSAKPEGDRG